MLPPLNALRAFEFTARLGGVNRAAEALHVTHGAVSRQLRSLEQAIGQALFVKSGRGLVLTTAGLQLYQTTTQSFTEITQTWNALTSSRSTSYVLSCTGSMLARWIIPHLPQLEQEFPHLKLQWVVNEQMPDAYISGVDAALVLTQSSWPETWQVNPLAIERIGVIVSPKIYSELSLSNPSELIKYPLLHTHSRPQAWQLWAEYYQLSESLHLGQGFDHLYYLLEAAIAGLGIAIAPELLVKDAINKQQLIAPWGFIETPYSWALCQSQQRQSNTIIALAEWLKKQFN